MAEQATAFLLQGQRAAERFPLGLPASVERLQAGALREFYRAHYRPERAVLIVVGDVSDADIRQCIERYFGSWRGRGTPASPANLGRPQVRGSATQVFSEPGAAG